MAKSKKKPSPAQLAARAKFAAMAKARSAAGKHKTGKHVGTGKKVAKAVKKAEKKAEHQIDAAAQKAYRKASRALRKSIGAKAYRGKGKMHGPHLPPGGVPAMQTAVAVKRVADSAAHDMKAQAKRLALKLRNECRKELRAVKSEAEKALAAAKAAGKKPHNHSQAAVKRAKKSKAKKSKAKKHAKRSKHAASHVHPLAAAHTHHAKPAKKRGKKRGRKGGKKGGRPAMFPPPSMLKHGPSRHHGLARMGGESRSEVSAADILVGARRKVKGVNLSFWACAGPVRSGCGSTGHVVRGVREKSIPAVRIRPGAKEVRI